MFDLWLLRKWPQPNPVTSQYDTHPTMYCKSQDGAAYWLKLPGHALPLLDSRALPIVSLLVLEAGKERVPQALLIADDADEFAVRSLAQWRSQNFKVGYSQSKIYKKIHNIRLFYSTSYSGTFSDHAIRSRRTCLVKSNDDMYKSELSITKLES